MSEGGVLGNKYDREVGIEQQFNAFQKLIQC